jgi:hypothetical protein
MLSFWMWQECYATFVLNKFVKATFSNNADTKSPSKSWLTTTRPDNILNTFPAKQDGIQFSFENLFFWRGGWGPNISRHF